MGIIKVFCRKCNVQLLTYVKRGTGGLRKCYLSKIKKNFTSSPGICQGCGSNFARPTVIKNLPALKIVGGKVYWK